MPGSNTRPPRRKRKPANYAAEFQRQQEKLGCGVEEFIRTVQEMCKRQPYAGYMAQLSAVSGNSVDTTTRSMICEYLVKHGLEPPREMREHLLEHARMTPEDRKKLMPFDLN